MGQKFLGLEGRWCKIVRYRQMPWAKQEGDWEGAFLVPSTPSPSPGQPGQERVLVAFLAGLLLLASAVDGRDVPALGQSRSSTTNNTPICTRGRRVTAAQDGKRRPGSTQTLPR